jgi:hypothetical protein
VPAARLPPGTTIEYCPPESVAEDDVYPLLVRITLPAAVPPVPVTAPVTVKLCAELIAFAEGDTLTVGGSKATAVTVTDAVPLAEA